MNIATHKQRRNSVEEAGGANLKLCEFPTNLFWFCIFIYNHLQATVNRAFKTKCWKFINSMLTCYLWIFKIVKKIYKIKTNLSEIRKALKLPPASSTEFRRCLCVAIFIILESQSEKLWHQNGIVQNMDWTGLDSWTGQLDWTIGLDNWTGQLDWTAGLDSWTGLLDWDSFLLNRRNSMFLRKVKWFIFKLLCISASMSAMYNGLIRESRSYIC